MKKHIHLILVIFPILFFLFLSTNSKLVSSVDAQAADNPYITTKVGAKISPSSKLADFITYPKVSIDGGTQTTACKLGANSAQLMSTLGGLGQKFLEKGYSYGWLLGIVTKTDEVEGALGIIDDLQKNGTNFIIRACYDDVNGCDIAPRGASKDVIKNDATAYARSAIALAGKSKYPFWIVGGHNEPNSIEKRSADDEALFLKTFMDTISTPSNYTSEFYATRSKINVLAPILDANTATVGDSSSFEDYIKAMENSKSASTPNLFGGIVGFAFNAYSVPALTRVTKFAEERKVGVYITETGSKTGNGKSVTNAEFNTFRTDIIDQFKDNPNIKAMLIFNGMLTDTQKKHGDENDQKEAERLLPNSSDYLIGVHGDKLEPTTYCPEKSEDPDCIITNKNNNASEKNQTWQIYYESQILTALSTAGCSNTFVRTCSYDNDFVKTINTTPSESTSAYFDMVDPVRSGTKFENQGIGKVEIDTGRCAVKLLTNGTCPYNERIFEVWDNVLKDAVFTANIVNTVQVDVPLLKSIASTNINGTDELSYTSYGGSLNRKRYEVNKDFTRKADATAKVKNIDGSSTQVSIPLLGSASLLYSRDFEDYSSYDPDTVRSPLDFLKETYNGKSSATDKRIEERSTNYGLTSISDFSKVGMLKSTGLDEFTVTPTSRFQTGNIPVLKTTENNDVSTTQFNSSQVLSGESIVRNTSLDSESDTVKCSDFSSILGSQLDVPVDARTASGYGTCESTETPAGDHYLATKGGAIVQSFEKGHFVTLSPKCFKAWCADPKKKKPLSTILPASGHVQKRVENIARDKMYLETGNSGSDMYFLKKITYQGSNLDSMSALLRIMRTAWEQSNRLNYESDRRICHKNISTTVNTYTRQYTVSSLQTNFVTGNNDQCSNPNNAAYIGNLRPAIKSDDNTKSFITSTSQIPFLGTVAAINERLSKADYSVSASTPLQECGAEGDNYFACLCKEDTESPYITKDPDPLAVFLCQNGMLTLNEIMKAKIDPKLCLEGPRNTSIYSDGVFGNATGIQSCKDAVTNDKIRNALLTASQIGKVPTGVIMAIWQEETSCSHVNNVDPINDTSLYQNNNEICVQRGCDVRGPFQFKDSTFTAITTKPEFNACRAAIGVDISTTPLRNRWGDGLCANAIKLGEDGLASNLESWDDNNTKNAARSYLGACTDLGVDYCGDILKLAKEYTDLVKTVNK